MKNLSNIQAFSANTIRSAREQILLICPTNKNIFHHDELGIINAISEVARNNVKVRIIMPENKLANDNAAEKFKNYPNVIVKFLEHELDPPVMFLIADESLSFVMEIRGRDDDGNHDPTTPHPSTITESTLGRVNDSFAYSDNRAMILSHIATFETLWKLIDLHEQTKNYNKMQEDFINLAAHELRTPIQPILVLSTLLLKKTADPENRQKLEVINRSAKRLRNLAEDILDIARIESQSLRLNKEKFNLNDLIYDIIDDYRNNIIRKDQNGNPELFLNESIDQEDNEEDEEEEEVFFIEADKGRLNQVISNILNNAIKFSPAGGNIDISLKKKEDGNPSVVISVKDSGSGIDEKIYPALFTKFATKSNKGTGLGMYISKNLITAHGGKIWAQNNSNGIGCTFYVELPILILTQPMNLNAQTEVHQLVAKILVVDDDQDFLSNLKKNLADHGYNHIHTFADPVKALENFIAGFYDLVIIDLEMPKMNGFDLYQEIRKTDTKVKVWFLTAGKTHYKALREIYKISDDEQFIEKTVVIEKILKQSNLLLKSR